MSNAVDASKVQIDWWKNDTQAAAPGAPIVDRANTEKNQKYYGNIPGYDELNEDIWVPFDSEVIWEYDFYKHQWDRGLKKDLYLVCTILECTAPDPYTATNRDYVTVGYGTIKINNPDATLWYGTYEISVYEPPAKIWNHDPDKKTPATIKLTISQYVPWFKAPEEFKNEPF